MRKLKYIAIFILLWILSCKTKTDIVNPDTELIVTTTVKGVSTSGVKVYLFDNQTYYQADSSNGLASKLAVDSGVSANGTITFHNLDASKHYWLHVTYTDPVSKYSYNNLNSYNYVYNTLTSGSQTYVTVDLEKTQTFIAFWVADSTRLPIHVVINNDTFLLNSYITTLPDQFDSTHYVKANLQPQTYQYYAYNKEKGFFEQGSVTLVNKHIKLQKLTNEAVGKISFYYSGTNTYVYPITVISGIGNQDTVGVINNYKASYSCGGADQTNVISAFKTMDSTYTYTVSTRSGCEWQGQVTLSDTCTVVDLAANSQCQ